jgi:hypothetical protein
MTTPQTDNKATVPASMYPNPRDVLNSGFVAAARGVLRVMPDGLLRRRFLRELRRAYKATMRRMN